MRDKFVYDFGCAGDPHECADIVKRHSTTARGYVGFDCNADAVRELQRHGYDARVLDFDHPSAFVAPPAAVHVPALILLNEVLEHLVNPGSALRQLREMATNTTPAPC